MPDRDPNRWFDLYELAEKLLATGDEEVVEGNTWHDRYWGRCKCVKHEGECLNWLGRILMRVRADLRKGDNTEA